MSGRVAIAGFLPEELGAAVPLDQPFRARQIFGQVARGARSFDGMTDLPEPLRSELAETACVVSGQTLQTLTDRDGTVKLQVAFPDGARIEAVLLADSSGGEGAARKTACVSCQAGCALGCAFCRTGRLGFTRDLSAAEIVEQFLLLESRAGTLDSVVFMGMGEPLLNLGAVRKAAAVLTHPLGRGLSVRRMTLSTAGIVAGIYELADAGPAVRLAVSLTTADPALREELMPVARDNPLPDLQEAVRYYARKTGRRCTLEAALLSGRNTSRSQMRLLAAFARDTGAHVNLIPWNPLPGLPFAEPTDAECREALRELARAGVNATLRTKRGRGIGGACGQLGGSRTA